MNSLVGQQKTLLKDCEVTVIPDGQPLLLTKDMEATITQALGGNLTLSVGGYLVLMMEEDADAIGIQVDPKKNEFLHDNNLSVEDKAWTLMKHCYDPEIPVNVVDLGLIYGCNVLQLEEPGKYRVHVPMTLTMPACGMGPVIVEEIKRKIMLIDDVKDVVVELVFDPPWSQDMMSEVAKLKLGML